jgi:hypothetical protein
LIDLDLFEKAVEAMTENGSSRKEEFLHPQTCYYGNFTPSNLVFNANLQKFSSQVGYVCGLESNGKISSAEAYQHIKLQFKQLKQSKKALGIGNQTPRAEQE